MLIKTKKKNKLVKLNHKNLQKGFQKYKEIGKLVQYRTSKKKHKLIKIE